MQGCHKHQSWFSWERSYNLCFTVWSVVFRSRVLLHLLLLWLQLSVLWAWWGPSGRQSDGLRTAVTEVLARGMLRWSVHLEGGPRRVNHAAVAVGHKVYSFGGYCSGEDYETLRQIDVHVFNTGRWWIYACRSSGKLSIFFTHVNLFRFYVRNL